MKASIKKIVAEQTRNKTAWEDGWVISKAQQKRLIREFGFSNQPELIRAILEEFTPPEMQEVSRFAVVAAAVEWKTSDLLLGCNVEFPGLEMSQTLHAEQFLALRSWMRGSRLKEIHLLKPTPCGHCRQFLNEFHLGATIRVRNSRGLDQTIGDLLPNSFGPRDLARPGLKPGALNLKKSGLKVPVSRRLADLAEAALAHSYAPYTRRPQAVAIETEDGVLIPGASLENAAFNPSVEAHTVVVAQLIASGRSLEEIKRVLLVGARTEAGRRFFENVSPGALVKEVRS